VGRCLIPLGFHPSGCISPRPVLRAQTRGNEDSRGRSGNIRRMPGAGLIDGVLAPPQRDGAACAARPGRSEPRGCRCGGRGRRRSCGWSIDRIGLRTRWRRCCCWCRHRPPGRAAQRFRARPRASRRGSAQLRHGVHAMYGRQWRACAGARPCSRGLRGARGRRRPGGTLPTTASAVPAPSASSAATVTGEGECCASLVSASMCHRDELLT